MATKDITALREQIKDNVEVALPLALPTRTTTRSEIKIITLYDGQEYQACAHVGDRHTALIEGPMRASAYDALEGLLETSSRMLWKFKDECIMDRVVSEKGYHRSYRDLGVWKDEPAYLSEEAYALGRRGAFGGNRGV